MQVCTFPGTSKTRGLCAWGSKREVEERDAGMKERKKERRKKTAKCLSMWASSMKGTFLGPSPLDTLYTVVPILRWVTFAVSSVSGLPLPGSDLPGMKPEEHAAQGLR